MIRIRNLLIVSILFAVFMLASMKIAFDIQTLDFIGVAFVVLSVCLAGSAVCSIFFAVKYGRIRLEATTDSLTGVANLRYLQVRLEHELERVKRYGIPLSVVLLELDGFKNVMERYGHNCANEVLKSISSLIKKRARSADLISRYGEDKFCVVLFHTDSKGAQVFAERLRLAVANNVFKCAASDLKLTLSVGISSFDKNIVVASEVLLEQADVALYESSGAGKNRVSLFRQNLPKP